MVILGRSPAYSGKLASSGHLARSCGAAHLKGEILLLNSAYWASRNSPTIVSGSTHSLTNPSPNTGHRREAAKSWKTRMQVM